MREERAASESAPIRLRPGGIWHRHRGPIYGSECSARLLPRGCRGGGRGAAGRREGGAPRWTSPGGTGNNPLRTKQVWPTFHWKGCGRDDAERAPGAPRPPLLGHSGQAAGGAAVASDGALVDFWLPRAGRGAVPWVRCRQRAEPEKSVRPVWHNFRKPRTMVNSARSGSSVG